MGSYLFCWTMLFTTCRRIVLLYAELMCTAFIIAGWIVICLLFVAVYWWRSCCVHQFVMTIAVNIRFFVAWHWIGCCCCCCGRSYRCWWFLAYRSLLVWTLWFLFRRRVNIQLDFHFDIEMLVVFLEIEKITPISANGITITICVVASLDKFLQTANLYAKLYAN